MLNTIITFLQVFGIGFSFGIIGPCFLVCTPILITYIAGSKRRWVEALGDTFIFLSGRLSAYIFLGLLAGLSGTVLNKFTGSNLTIFFKPLGGAVSIVLGLAVLTRCKGPEACASSHSEKKIYSFGGLFTLGVVVGITPCAPLLTLLFQITLISKNALEGASYALAFGLGTFLSGLIVVGTIAGVFTGFAAKFLKSKTSNFIFRIICGLLLILLGLSLILGRYTYSA